MRAVRIGEPRRNGQTHEQLRRLRVAIAIVELRDAAVAEQLAKAHEGAGRLGNLDREQRLALRPHVRALRHVAQPVEVHVRPAVDGDQRATAARFARHVFLDARDRERSGGLRDGARVLEDVLDGGADLIRGHEQHLVDVLLGEAKGFLADAPHGDAVGKDADARQRDALAGAQRLEHAGRILGLNADDLDARIERLHVCGDAGDEPAAADRNEDRLDAVAVPWRRISMAIVP